MNKLNEIEARAATIAITNQPLSFEIQKDFDLLIRAVRQLGGRHVSLTVNFDSLYVLDSIEKRTPIDPDVMELLEDTNENDR